uniref:Leucine rich repeats-containing protein n=1 Tax=Trepomonas sp. PC1 TaxID=1076344 RepID=A0A146KKN2_9EUKA|eukprot:JAP95976.1 Leucine rich repeats-containing protein [Trepomonas sp. PC1]
MNHQAILFVHCPKLEVVHEEGFKFCRAMRYLYSKRLRTIKTDAFLGCLSLVKISLGNVTELEPRSLMCCQSLVSVHLEKLTFLQNMVFQTSYSLKKVHCPVLQRAEQKPFQSIKQVSLFCPEEMTDEVANCQKLPSSKRSQIQEVLCIDFVERKKLVRSVNMNRRLIRIMLASKHFLEQVGQQTSEVIGE